ncbi:MAG: zf-HC2 domain-containing protein [Pyrinomonadaceae bacterium]|nr:zf-HC2 domain-containing protein [Pyrinomonadaceae bacterium]
MSQDSDKEMDLLLRRHTRRGVAGVPGAKPDARHMDADELSAYAKGALPDASRSRYASHLADCDSCRKIVTELVLSSSVEAEASGTVAQTIDAPKRSWREWLGALFSPPVLRYAAPVLALVAFASIVFIIVNRNREIPSFVSQNEPSRQQQNANTETRGREEEQPATGASNDTVDNHGGPASANVSSNTAPTASVPELRASKDASTATTETNKDAPAGAPKTADVSAGAPAAAAPPPPTVQEREGEAKQPAAPAQNTSPLSNMPVDRVKEKDDVSLADKKRRESGGFITDGATAKDAAGAGRRSQEPSNRGALGAATSTASEEKQQKNEVAKSAPAARARRDTSGADEDYRATETRTVAGKRFRQQNGIWTDTSYNSSRQLVRVKRGSEQYRSLVADEPVIATVSNSFSGDVIVVVRGRAYHIY